MLIKTILLITFSLSCAISSPVPSKKGKDASHPKEHYDQRQEGQWNVRAHLDNFVIMIIPTQSLVGPSSSSPSILDFFKKTLPKRNHLKRGKHDQKHKRPDSAQETMHFIESKTAPYHVDITKSKSTTKDELVESTPEIALITSDIPMANIDQKRISRHFILTVPADEEYTLTRMPGNITASKKVKKTSKEVMKNELKLLGAENEECGPGLERDSIGICRTSMKV
ncbi:uncharacterized protein isoform X1 [Leptinotarsa decemlineata]|uniref:uncharacterized protein isoform X1 n=1 Tax=Leptinotarsa decemlineata TaxID=7539 RepID=UPI003D305D4F